MRGWTCLTVAVAIFSSASALADGYVGVPFSRDHVVAQKPFACFPTAIFNALQLGRDQIDVVGHFKSRNLEDAYGRYLSWISNKPSMAEPECPRLAPVGSPCDFKGTFTEDQPLMLKDVFKELNIPAEEYRGTFLEHLTGEPGPRFVQRIHEKILASLSQGVPVVARLMIHPAGQETHGHADTIFEVSDKVIYSDNYPSGAFLIRVFEQDAPGGQGAVDEFLVHERLTQVQEGVLSRGLTTGGQRDFEPARVNANTFASPFLQLDLIRQNDVPANDPYDMGVGPDSYVLIDAAFGAFPSVDPMF